MKRSFKGNQKTINMAHTSREPWTFTPKKNKDCSLLLNRIICENPPEGEKTTCLRNKNAHKLDTVKCVLEKAAMLLDFMTEELWWLSILSSQKLGEFLFKKNMKSIGFATNK